MLELAAVITTGGLLLFSTTFPIDLSLFTSVVNLINDARNLQATIILYNLKINYLYDALLGLVYIIAWRKEISLEYPDKLLKAMSIEWKNASEKLVWKDKLLLESPEFKPLWERAFSIWKDYIVQKQETTKGKMTSFQQNNKSKKKQKVQTKTPEESTPGLSQTQSQTSEEDRSVSSENVSQTPTPQETQWDNLSPRERFQRNQKSKLTKKVSKQSPKKQDDKEKETRKWEGKYTKKDIQQLDRSKLRKKQSEKAVNVGKYLIEDEKTPAGFLDSDEEDNEEKSNSFLNKWVSKFKNVVGDKVITKEDLLQVLDDFKQKLMEKNVALQVAVHVADAVGSTLLESKTKSFTSVHKTVKEAMKEALRKILTPKRKIDLIVQVTKERQKLKPYVIVFVGVNGVGKSTNLAKVAYKLKNAQLSVMLAACDNFRAGAVEQIQTHGRNLDIPVFQRGYKQEPAMIAYEAIKDATRKHVDAVLVDTAGRMQDNTPLMKQLARLVKMNKPNLVVFIGEALVGNDAVDQITKFNKALLEESTETFKPEIDAILLSKFDTVDDKVGTALSLVYSTSKPILYVGVGQKYPNLKELNVSTVVNALLA